MASWRKCPQNKYEGNTLFAVDRPAQSHYNITNDKSLAMALLTLIVCRSRIYSNYSDHVVSSANMTIERLHTLCALEIMDDMF